MTAYRLGLVGSGIDRSLAPAFHELAGQLTGLDVSYELIPHDADDPAAVEPLLRQLARDGFRGLNITVPFKASAWQSATAPSPEVIATGVANTLLLGPDGPSRACNTDFSGFKWAYHRQFGAKAPGVVAVLGAGGVGTAVSVALADLGATSLRIFDLVPGRSGELARSLRARHRDVDVTVAASAEGAVDGADGVVNGTPVGMHWKPGSPVDLAAVGGQSWVFDAIYSPVETPLMIWAAASGMTRITGFDLFLGQAIDAFEIFTGRNLTPPVVSRLRASMERLERERGI
jgi:shikimate dehydrogenase